MEENPESKIFAVKTSIGEEENVAEMVYARADYKGLPLWSILISPETDGYIFVEAPSMRDVLRATENIKPIKKVLERPASEGDVERLLNPRPAFARVSYGDTVEITEGEFEGERGRITNISHSEKEATVEVETAVIPFSTTVDMDGVKPVAERKG